MYIVIPIHEIDSLVSKTLVLEGIDSFEQIKGGTTDNHEYFNWLSRARFYYSFYTINL